VQVDARVRTC